MACNGHGWDLEKGEGRVQTYDRLGSGDPACDAPHGAAERAVV